MKQPSTAKRERDGALEVVSTHVGAGGRLDAIYYYNLVDYSGDMSDEVSITRHDTLEAAVAEAKRLARERRPGAKAAATPFDLARPPRIVRTVRVVEVHRIESPPSLPIAEAAWFAD